MDEQQNQQPNQPVNPDLKTLDDLHGDPKNPRILDEHEGKALGASIQKFGDLGAVVFNVRTQQLVGGHQRVEIMKRLPQQHRVQITNRYDSPDPQDGTVALGYIWIGNKPFAYREVDWDEPTQRAANIAANRIQGRFDNDLLAQVNYELSQLDNGEELLGLTGQTEFEVKKLLNSVGVGSGGEGGTPGALADNFIAPPFSILDTKQGYWQDRRDEWLAMGIKSELGREDKLLSKDENMLASINGGTSIFDPVLCEVMYRWFNIDGGQVLDPFAGGSVRGVVAHKLGMPYLGIDLSAPQIAANKEQGVEIFGEGSGPAWLVGDGMDVATLAPEGFKADFIFSWPPYADLEVYSDLPNDLSNMEYEAFCSAYWDIISRSVALLNDNRFAAFVVSEVRDKKGIYRNLVGDTINAFTDAGLQYYNEIILVNSAGTLPLRAGRQFNAGRKVGRQHQNVLVFYKGDPKKIKETFGELDFSQLPDGQDGVSELG